MAGSQVRAQGSATGAWYRTGRPTGPSVTLAAMTARRVAIVPHTHWDREWYEPFQTFRLKLVDLLDGLLPT